MNCLQHISNVFIAQVTELGLVFVEHLVEGVVELAGDGVDLQLLPDDLVLQLVNPEQQDEFGQWDNYANNDGSEDDGDGGDPPEVKLGDVHLGVLGPRVRLFQPDVQLLDLVLNIFKFVNLLMLKLDAGQRC